MSKVYFGNANKQTWIKAPKSGMKGSSRGFIAETQLLNGQTFIKRSQGSHRRFDMSWLGPMNDRDITESLYTIKDFADGVYGDGPFFWIDPFAASSNLFSPAWAAPSLSIGSDWESICPDNPAITKSKVTTASISALVGANTYGYPIEAAKFEIPGTGLFQSNSFTFYIPSGFTLHLGVHGHSTSSGGAYYRPSLNGVVGSATQITLLGVNANTITNTSIASTTADKVEVYFAKTTTSACTFHVVGLVAQLIKTGATPETGNFISGRGTNKLEFSAFPEIDYYSSNINNGQIGMSVSFAEV